MTSGVKVLLLYTGDIAVIGGAGPIRPDSQMSLFWPDTSPWHNPSMREQEGSRNGIYSHQESSIAQEVGISIYEPDKAVELHLDNVSDIRVGHKSLRNG